MADIDLSGIEDISNPRKKITMDRNTLPEGITIDLPKGLSTENELGIMYLLDEIMSSKCSPLNWRAFEDIAAYNKQRINRIATWFFDKYHEQ